MSCTDAISWSWLVWYHCQIHNLVDLHPIQLQHTAAQNLSVAVRQKEAMQLYKRQNAKNTITTASKINSGLLKLMSMSQSCFACFRHWEEHVYSGLGFAVGFLPRNFKYLHKRKSSGDDIDRQCHPHQHADTASFGVPRILRYPHQKQNENAQLICQ